jgi:serine protease AprX
MAWRNRLFVCLLFSTGWVSAQSVNRYVIFFKDKQASPFSITRPQEFLSQKSIDRRTKQGIELSEEDIPVNQSYVLQVRNAGARTFFTSRWMNALLVETDVPTLDQIKLLPFVLRTEYVAPNQKLSVGRVRKMRSRKDNSIAPATRNQLQMLGIDKMQEDGLKGEGVTIAVFDGGFLGVNSALPFQAILNENRLRDSFDFVARSGNVFAYDDHGTEVLSIISAFNEGNYTGGAYKANFQLYVTEDVDSEYRIEEYNWLFAAERADSAGVDVINSSLGYNLFDDVSMDYSKARLDGKSAVVSQAASKALSKGIVVVCSAGNEGNNSWRLVTPPADVDGVLAIGSVTSTNTRSGFSSIGPTADNRIKPDVVGMGSGTSIIRPNGLLGTQSGTSVSSPLIASLAAGVIQAYPQLSSIEVYNAILRSGDQFSNPDNLKGYGLPSYMAIKNYLETFTLEDEIVLYPNPITSTTIHIAIKNLVADPTQIQVFDVSGKRVLESQLLITKSTNPLEYDMSSLGAGSYLIKVKSGSHLKIIRVVKPQ